jgi:integrase
VARQEGRVHDAKIRLVHELAFPALGSRPIAEISAREVLVVLKEVEARSTYETARKLGTAIGDVFHFAIVTARADNDPTLALRGGLVTPTVMARAAIIAPKALGGLLRAIEDYEGMPETRAALELLALTFMRPGELRAAEWTEFDLDSVVWEIPSGRMKMRKPHRVPLAARAVSLLKERNYRAKHAPFSANGFVRLTSILAPHGPIPVGRSTWWAGVKSGRFPKSVSCNGFDNTLAHAFPKVSSKA